MSFFKNPFSKEKQMITEDIILASLKDIKDPFSGESLIQKGMISPIIIQEGRVQFAINIDPNQAQVMEKVRLEVQNRVASLEGVVAVSLSLTAERKPSTAQNHTPSPHKEGPPEKADYFPEVKAIIAIASGKGGVGKSTTAVNLAIALKDCGYAVGLYDADIFGPSQPRLMGVAEEKPHSVSEQDHRLEPILAQGIKMMSIGFLIPEDSPVVWRGPMVMRALEQLMRDVHWGSLDILIIDMPPGTGDTQLTICQKLSLAGAIIVSTPQDIAMIDAKKGLQTFLKMDVPILGIIENMSLYHCPQCGHEAPLFGHGGAEAEAKKLNIPFLGALPLDIDIRLNADSGTPIVQKTPQSSSSQIYLEIARKIAHSLFSPSSGA
jgi:ATP-binding protein involved in chromosome partitioning